jgi:drug/metabolite transporter (DMT)-like permease
MIYGLLAVTFWGASFAATKLALQEIDPVALVFLRTGIGILVLALVTLGVGGFQSRPDMSWLRLLILGFLGVTFHQWIQAQGLQTTSTTDTGWIIATIPIFTALLSWRFLGEGMSMVRVLGIGLGTAGVLLVVSDGRLVSVILNLSHQVGNGLIVVSALNWAVFTVLSKRWLFNQESQGNEAETPRNTFRSMLQSMLILMILGWLIMLPWVFTRGGISGLAVRTSSTLVSVLFLGIACSGLAYIFWYYALIKLNATETSALLYFEPLVTQAVAWLYLGESFNLAIVFGGLTILCGVWLVNRP